MNLLDSSQTKKSIDSVFTKGYNENNISYCFDTKCTKKDTVFINNYERKRLNISKYKDITNIKISDRHDVCFIDLNINISYDKFGINHKKEHNIRISYQYKEGLKVAYFTVLEGNGNDKNLLNIELTKALIDTYFEGNVKVEKYNLYFQYGYIIDTPHDTKGIIFNASDTTNKFLGGHILYENILPIYVRLKK